MIADDRARRFDARAARWADDLGASGAQTLDRRRRRASAKTPIDPRGCRTRSERRSATTASCSTTPSCSTRCTTICSARGRARISTTRAAAAAGRRARPSAPSSPRPTATWSRSPATASTCSARAIHSLWSAAQYNAPYLTIVYQNRSYSTGTLRVARSYPDGYAAKAGYHGGYFDPPIDFAKEAEAAGAYGENVTDPAEVAPALQRGLASVRDGTSAVISVWLARYLQDD